MPLFLLARRMGIATVYLEVFDRVDSPTLTGRMARPVTDLFCCVQWPEQQAHDRGSVVIGPIL